MAHTASNHWNIQSAALDAWHYKGRAQETCGLSKCYKSAIVRVPALRCWSSLDEHKGGVLAQSFLYFMDEHARCTERNLVGKALHTSNKHASVYMYIRVSRLFLMPLSVRHKGAKPSSSDGQMARCKRTGHLTRWLIVVLTLTRSSMLTSRRWYEVLQNFWWTKGV